VKNWDIKASNSGHVGVNVERVPVARETVEGSLVLAGLLSDNVVGLAAGGLVGGSGGTAIGTLLLSAKVASTADEHGELVDADVIAVLVNSLDSNGGNASLTLVEDINNIGGGDQLAVGGEGLDDLEVLLTVEEHHGVERGEDLAKGNRVHGSERGDDTEGGDGAESLVVLVNEVQVLATGTDSEVVQDNIALRVLKDLGLEGQALGSLNIDLAVGRDDLGAGRSIASNVLKVGHDALHGLGGRGGVGGATILKVGDLGPLARDLLGQEGLVNGEAVAPGTLPAELSNETSTDLEDGSVLGGVFVAEVLDQGSDHLGLQGGEHVWGEDGLGHTRGSHGGNDVAVNVVFLSLESKSLGQTDKGELGSRVVGLACMDNEMYYGLVPSSFPFDRPSDPLFDPAILDDPERLTKVTVKTGSRGYGREKKH